MSKLPINAVLICFNNMNAFLIGATGSWPIASSQVGAGDGWEGRFEWYYPAVLSIESENLSLPHHTLDLNIPHDQIVLGKLIVIDVQYYLSIQAK